MVWLDNSRIIAILAVVVLHAAVSPVVDTPFGSTDWWAGNLINAFSRWCVPVFVMISGALLLAPGKTEGAGTFYRKRAARVVVPLLFWSAFYLLWVFIKGSLKGNPPGAAALLHRISIGEPYYHLWFLYMLVPLYLVTPVLRQIVARTTRKQLTWLVALAFVLAALNAIDARLSPRSSTFFPAWFLSYVPYFLLGHLIATDPRTRSPALLWSTLVASGLLTAVGCHALATRAGLQTGLYFYDYLSLTVIPMAASCLYLLKSRSQPLAGRHTRQLSGLTMGVYLLHPLAIEVLQRIGFGPLDYNPAMAIPAVAAVAFLAALAASVAISRLPYLRRTI
ncbi:membrane protein [Zoogloea oryzae]|uniref:Membrane protein n=1 Tax=Zoogloea oryzae TaxID=310767 RepID=A0ABQ6F7J0_9RHOO|nr:acyltransferase family protein [Zoogloea oryzae]GLT21189.1 membrane protein [Zoogloea oryzae]